MASFSPVPLHQNTFRLVTRRPSCHGGTVIGLQGGVSRPRFLFDRSSRAVSVRREGATMSRAIQSGRADTIWHSFKRLSPTSRMFYGFGVAIVAVGGMYISDQLRLQMPVPSEGPSDDAERKSQPALFNISIVDRKA